MRVLSTGYKVNGVLFFLNYQLQPLCNRSSRVTHPSLIQVSFQMVDAPVSENPLVASPECFSPESLETTSV